jgi:hypothetical protein
MVTFDWIWESRATMIELRIPKLRKGLYFRGLSGPAPHGCGGAGRLCAGVSSGSVDDLAQAIGRPALQDPSQPAVLEIDAGIPAMQTFVSIPYSKHDGNPSK